MTYDDLPSLLTAPERERVVELWHKEPNLTREERRELCCYEGIMRRSRADLKSLLDDATARRGNVPEVARIISGLQRVADAEAPRA